jgi:hypothetical protein
MPDRACPQLDWGSGMTSGNKSHKLLRPLNSKISVSVEYGIGVILKRGHWWSKSDSLSQLSEILCRAEGNGVFLSGM